MKTLKVDTKNPVRYVVTVEQLPDSTWVCILHFPDGRSIKSRPYESVSESLFEVTSQLG